MEIRVREFERCVYTLAKCGFGSLHIRNTLSCVVDILTKNNVVNISDGLSELRRYTKSMSDSDKIEYLRALFGEINISVIVCLLQEYMGE